MGKMKELYQDAKDNLAEEQDTFNLVILLKQRGSSWITKKLDELEQKMEEQDMTPHIETDEEYAKRVSEIGKERSKND
jgi:hypothetical protein